MTIACPRCGRPITEDDATACPNCGAPLVAPREPGQKASFSERYRGTAWDPALGPAPGAAVGRGTGRPIAGAGPLAILGGLAWLAFAAVTGLLAVQGFNAASLPVGTVVPLSPLTLWNGIAALVALVLGTLVVVRRSRRVLEASVAWGLGSAAGGFLQIGNAGSDVSFVLSVLLALAAGGLSLAARGALAAREQPE